MGMGPNEGSGMGGRAEIASGQQVTIEEPILECPTMTLDKDGNVLITNEYMDYILRQRQNLLTEKVLRYFAGVWAGRVPGGARPVLLADYHSFSYLAKP